MSNKFEQISVKPGFMKHNGGVLFRTISETEYEFKANINENHLNAAFNRVLPKENQVRPKEKLTKRKGS